MKWLVGGWQWSGLMEFETGRPFNVVSGSDRSGRGLGSTNDRAKLTGQPLEAPAGSDPTLWFNPAAFAAADVGTFGNVPKGFLYGPSFHSWNMGLFKNFLFTGDNRIAVNSANFGRITRTVPVTGDPRVVQFGLKFVF